MSAIAITLIYCESMVATPIQNIEAYIEPSQLEIHKCQAHGGTYAADSRKKTQQAHPIVQTIWNQWPCQNFQHWNEPNFCHR